MLTRDCRRSRRQRGIALVVTMIVLIALMLAGVALTRSVDTASIVAGNLAFKQVATAAGDTGIEAAIDWLESNNSGSTLFTTIDSRGYIANGLQDRPTSGQSWDDYWVSSLYPSGRFVTLGADTAGNARSFVIHRLCNGTGAPTSGGADCQIPPSSGTSGNSKRSSFKAPSGSNQAYYRITARVDGPRNTVSYVQVVVAL
jgi:type IV pilus assembly protein PilX